MPSATVWKYSVTPARTSSTPAAVSRTTAEPAGLEPIVEVDSITASAEEAVVIEALVGENEASTPADDITAAVGNASEKPAAGASAGTGTTVKGATVAGAWTRGAGWAVTAVPALPCRAAIWDWMSAHSLAVRPSGT